MKYLIGVDVGTTSARAGLFTADGHLLASTSASITVWRPRPNHAEQSSAEIWEVICRAVREILRTAGISADDVAGIGFDATCSLVVLDTEGQPLAVNEEGEDGRNVILWMDHRAVDQAERINAAGGRVLDFVGGRISPEMETPKLLWLAENLPRQFALAGHFMDLVDFLTWRSTGNLARSVCTVTSKWTYLPHAGGWDPNYFRAIGLGALADEDFARIGTEIVSPGQALAEGLTEAAACELGLRPRTPVSAGIIDAHAGALGTLGASGLEGRIEDRLAYVFGTSACTLNLTREPAFVDGVWGPYRDVLLPDFWVNEGGQSAAGAAIDHLVSMHPAAPELARRAEASGVSLTHHLDGLATALLREEHLSDLIDGLHVVPEFLGNRAPFADPDARAIIAGLGLERDERSLIRLYLAAVCSVGYGLRQICGALAEKGAIIGTVVISGGAGGSALVRSLLASAADVTIVRTRSTEPVLLGAAMLGSVAGGVHETLPDAMVRMAATEERSLSTDGSWHRGRYTTFERLQQVGKEIRCLPTGSVRKPA